MDSLTVLLGPRLGERFPLSQPRMLIGRDPTADLCLVSSSVSRNHAAVTVENGEVFVEDVGSRNGTYVNTDKITSRVLFTMKDQLTIGEFVFGLVSSTSESAIATADASNLIRERVQANLTNRLLFEQNPVRKLQVVLEITQDLTATMEVKPLLDNLLVRLLQLFPLADRGLILLYEEKKLTVQAQRSRRGGTEAEFPFSRTIVKKCLADGAGILSDDLGVDKRFAPSQSIQSSTTRSMMCVPLLARDGRRLGAVQLDQTGSGLPFGVEDLRLLTTIALQAAIVLENVEANAERLRLEMFRKELNVARDIQQGYLPVDFSLRPGYQPFACLQPARDFSGDLYDFFPLPDGRIAFLVGDVSGKGLPAAMFMVAVRTLARHIAPSSKGPAEMLETLNTALAADNPSMMFVTLAYGIFHPGTGEIVLASGGHPPPILVKRDGQTFEVEMPVGRALGYSLGTFALSAVTFKLSRGETLALYSDGISEAFAPDGDTMFGVEKLQVALQTSPGRPLHQCAEIVNDAVRKFTGPGEIQDDQTLFLLRRL